jgi:Predicted metal-dependent hydrolase of the TIM-barrel fold
MSLPRRSVEEGALQMIIDSHCHAGQGDILTYPANTTAPLDKYLRRAGRAGINRTIVLPAFHSDYAAANAQLARIVRRHANRLIGFAFVHSKRDAGRIHSMIERAVSEWRFRGIKVHGYDSLPTREVCDVARRFRLPVIVDVVGRAYVIDQFAPEYRDVNFIIAHMGSFLDDWRAQQLVCDQLVRHPNVYADTAGVRRFDYLVEAVKRAGPHKLIFGSDGPWLHPGLELYKIKLLGLPRQDEALITGGNIQRLMRNVCARQPIAAAADLDERPSRLAAT